VTRQKLITDFLRAQAGWRIANVGNDPVRTARSAAALLDAAAYAATLADDDPQLAALDRCGCFRGRVFDPGPAGVSLARWWQFRDGPHARPEDLISALAATAAAHWGPPVVPPQAGAARLARDH
jgi:hypothetical protein